MQPTNGRKLKLSVNTDANADKKMLAVSHCSILTWLHLRVLSPTPVWVKFFSDYYFRTLRMYGYSNKLLDPFGEECYTVEFKHWSLCSVRVHM